MHKIQLNLREPHGHSLGTTHSRAKIPAGGQGQYLSHYLSIRAGALRKHNKKLKGMDHSTEERTDVWTDGRTDKARFRL